MAHEALILAHVKENSKGKARNRVLPLLCVWVALKGPNVQQCITQQPRQQELPEREFPEPWEQLYDDCGV